MKKYVSELSISYKRTKVKTEAVVNSSVAYRAFREIWPDDINYTETFYIMTLDRANVITNIMLISKGGTAGTVVDAKVVFSAALLANASSLIFAHNHPSGNLKPSSADVTLTKKLTQAGRLLDIIVLDHLILSETYYRSMADEGDI